MEGFEEESLLLLRERVISTIIGIPVIFYLVYEGKILFLLFIIVLAVLAQYELNRIFAGMGYRIPRFLPVSGSVLFPFLAFYAPNGRESNYILAAVTVFLLLHLMTLMFLFPRYKAGEIAASFLGGCYCSLLLSYLILIRKMDGYGFHYLLMVFILTWCCDIGAYISGRLRGRKALCPLVSPGKTLEGAVGGLFFCVLAAVSYHYFYPHLFSYPLMILIGVIIGGAVEIGDLVESSLKRLGKIKDSGDLIPGHGGVLDRFDGLLFSAPVAYICIKLLSL